MPTIHPTLMLRRAAAGVLCLLATASCGGELLRTGRSPVYLSITTLEAARGGTSSTFTTNLLSDVITNVETTVGGTTVQVPTIFNDLGRATLRVDPKDATLVTGPVHAITITRYRVTFRRTDGRNAPGVDVPYAIDGGATATIQAGQTGQVSFDLVRHQAKSEPPLRNLINGGGLRFISAIAEVTLYGRDQNGNEVMVTGNIDVQFGDFGDE